MTPTLKGIEIYGRDDCNLIVESGCDDVIILRRVEGGCSYSICTKLIPRDLSEAEMIEKAR